MKIMNNSQLDKNLLYILNFIHISNYINIAIFIFLNNSMSIYNNLVLFLYITIFNIIGFLLTILRFLIRLQNYSNIAAIILYGLALLSLLLSHISKELSEMLIIYSLLYNLINTCALIIHVNSRVNPTNSINPIIVYNVEEITIDLENQYCSICLNTSDDNKNFVKTSCNHSYHQECINNWLNSQETKTCPMCRNNLI